MKVGIKRSATTKQRSGLSLLFAAAVFCGLLITLLFVGALVAVGDYAGWFEAMDLLDKPFLYFILIAGFCLILGTGLSYVFGIFVLKPVNKTINAMNRLAGGEYDTRLSLRGLAHRNSAAVELTESFNQLAEELSNTEILRKDFINNFSHEFKTPITSITGFAGLLKRPGIGEEERREYAGIIESESKRLGEMASRVLQLSRLEAQAGLSDVTSYDLTEQLRTCVLLLEERWEEKKLSLLVPEKEYSISGNKELLEQVWLNLMDNAIKFTPVGGRVEISIRQDRNATAVTIVNTGNRIPPEAIKKVFQKFYQGEESHSTQGNGIGLAIVKRVAELHGGSVRVKNMENGVAFTVELP